MISRTGLLILAALLVAGIGLGGFWFYRTFEGGRMVVITVDAEQNRHPISPLIYGINGADTATLIDLGLALNRYGGNDTSLYNWQLNARNTGKDWFFESVPADGAAEPGAFVDNLIDQTRKAGAEPMVTIPILGRVAKLGPDRAKLSSYSVVKYGPQQMVDAQWDPDAGNGIRIDGTSIGNNDPNDATLPSGPDDQRAWVDHLIARWGAAKDGGVRYYILGNEPGLWFRTHRDVAPQGLHAGDYRDRVIAYAKMVHAADPDALIVAPEEWGWSGYRYSGFDQQYGALKGWGAPPDRTNVTGGLDYLPWLLNQWKSAGHPVDVVSVHYYPEGGVYSDDASEDMQLLRNRSTRSLWDPNYVDKSWINAPITLIPRLKQWVATYYTPGTPIAVTEYSWGADKSMNGATAQADVLGIFGREGLDMAARWGVPDPVTPTYQAFRLYRNYDGHGARFGDISLAAAVPDPDMISAFAGMRGHDGAITIIVINKNLHDERDIALHVVNAAVSGTVQVYQLADDGVIRHRPDQSLVGAVLKTTLPRQSVTLFVLPGVAG